MKNDFMFSSESVTEGHPDKLCDQISDAIVDKFLQKDPYSRVIAECAVATAIVFIAARFESDAVVDFTKTARQVIKQVGYDEPDFNAKTCSIVTSVKELLSHDYRYWDAKRLSDDEMELIPVKDQVTVFGFACNQTPALIPLPIWLAHQLARRLTAVRQEKILPYIRPDGKTQVGIEYRDRKPYRIHSISILASHNQQPESYLGNINTLQEEIKETIIDYVLKDNECKPDEKTRILIDFDEPFSIGGPSVHSGLTGRKNAIDTYGGYSRHSGAALSGKDPTRIDRVGAYAARYAAKNVVAAGLAEECEVQLTYSIGVARPVSIQVETFGTGKISDEEIKTLLEKHFDFRLAGIIKKFNLRLLPTIVKGGFYKKLAVYGHVGRLDLEIVPWEEMDMVPALLE
ncbi:methionine adenosyltransferase [Chlorogloeopsis fritschii PCC 9212]|uniref:Methionine adenosyltransferase n=1 Tax=Chlorogloeopsis fritschii PCC 6912 TaxID=211165 RepID=A0A3S0ZB66_CHLFR|nr:methionine adenosyltransferase [Chlorogloeopsis fritschii]RUR72684.1 S-adenosylmethionine synthase [Chlorogloeopsis fritschii PCC 6912]